MAGQATALHERYLHSMAAGWTAEGRVKAVGIGGGTIQSNTASRAPARVRHALRSMSPVSKLAKELSAIALKLL